MKNRHKLSPEVDYRALRFSNLTSPTFKHLFYLLYWLVFGLFFAYVERLQGARDYYPVYSPLDDLIPFCEWFLLPYLFWFVYLVGFHLYALVFDVEAFRRLMRFVMLTYSVSMLIYLFLPTCQELRPETFARDNFLTRFMKDFYSFDTNTNVCPSIHVIGSLAVCGAAWHSKAFRSPAWRTAFAVTAFLISISTVFLKQHSILDVFAAIPICALGWILFFRKPEETAQTPQKERPREKIAV